MCACIKIMSADNPASFTTAPLYVRLMAALCRSGPVVVVRLVFAWEDRPAWHTRWPALLFHPFCCCCCVDVLRHHFGVCCWPPGAPSEPLNPTWRVPLYGGICRIVRPTTWTGHWVKMGCFLPGPSNPAIAGNLFGDVLTPQLGKFAAGADWWTSWWARWWPRGHIKLFKPTQLLA